MNEGISVSNRIKLFGMQNLILETELARLENTIDIGHHETLKKEELVDVELFQINILKKARKMADFYVLYYCIENSIRSLISERMTEKYGATWWENKVPANVKTEVRNRQEQEKDTPMSIRSSDPLTYTTFGELIDIFNSNWFDFTDTIRSQKAMQATLAQLNKLRGVIAHSCDLNDDEIIRFKLLIKDWLRLQT